MQIIPRLCLPWKFGVPQKNSTSTPSFLGEFVQCPLKRVGGFYSNRAFDFAIRRFFVTPLFRKREVGRLNVFEMADTRFFYASFGKETFPLRAMIVPGSLSVWADVPIFAAS